MLESLTLHNFKCFPHQTIELAPLTLLAGLNSTGKSSVIEALLLLRQNQSWNFQELHLRGKYVDLGSGSDILCEYSNEDECGIELGFAGGSLEARWLATAENILTSSPNGVTMDKVSACPLFVQRDNQWLQFTYLSADRMGPRTSYLTSPENLSINPEIGNRGEYASHYLEMVANQTVPIRSLADANQAADTVNDQMDAWMEMISPGVHLKVASYADIDMVKFRYQYSVDGMLSREYRPINVGFGLTSIMPVILSVLTTQAGGIILLENPEIHIHPKGQTQLGMLLARAAQAGVQIIVETHSDHIINGLRLATKQSLIDPENILIQFFTPSVTSNGSAVESIRLDKQGKLQPWPDQFMSEWEDSLMQLI